MEDAITQASTESAVPSAVTGSSLRIGRLLNALILALTLPLILLLAYGINDETKHIRQRAEVTASSLALIAAHALERKLGDTHQFLSTLAARASARALDSKRCDPVFGDFQKSHAGFSALTTTMLSGQLICSSPTPKAERTTLSTALSINKKNGTPQFHLGRAQKGFITGRWVVPLSETLFDDQGVVVGSVTAWLDLESLNPLNDSSLNRLPKGTLVTVFDNDGVVLSRSLAAKQWIGINRAAFPQATKAFAQRTGTFQTTAQSDNIERLFAVSPVEGTQWLVVVGIPTAEMDAELGRAQVQGVSIIFLVLAFSALMLWLAHCHIAQPFRVIAATATAIRRGEREQRIDPGSVGAVTEVCDVAIRFNEMLDTLVAEREQLARSEAGFRTLFNEMRSGFALHEIICNGEGIPVDYRFIEVNPAFEEMTGLSAQHLIGKRVLEVMPELEPIWIERYGQVALSGEPAHFEQYSKDLNKHFDVRAFRTQTRQFGVMLLDVTERRLAEQALVQEKALLRRTIDTIPDLIYVKDNQGRYLGCNKAFEEFVGRSEAEQLGKTDFDFFDHKSASLYREQDRLMLESGETRQNDQWVTYPDGRKALLNTIKTPFATSTGETLGILGFSRDITAQHQAQDELRASADTFKAILATSLDGFWITNLEGQLLEVNDAYATLSGYSREELLTMRISDLEAQESSEMVARHIKRDLENGGDIFETRHRRKNGSIWQVEVNVTFWPEQARQFVFLRDICRRQRTELLARKRQELSTLASHNNLDGLMQKILDAAESFSESQIGFLHFVAPDQQSLTLQAWSTNTLDHMCNAEGKGQHYPIKQAGVWVDCVALRQPVIHNDYASLQHKKGLPDGHAPIVRELTVPVIRNNLVTAIIGVGNKPVPYTSEDVEIVSEFANIAMDLIDAKQADDELRQAAAIFENTQEGMMVTDTSEIIVRVNSAFSELTGYSAEEALGRTPSLLKSPRQDPKLFSEMRECLAKNGRWQGEITNRRKNGEDFPQWMSISSILDTVGNICHYVSTFSDITQIKKAEERIHNLAFFDPLTQLPNRRLLLDRLHRAVASSARRATCGAVMMMDLDNFKILNDSEGHEAGDLLLIEVGRRLQNCVRDQDSVARQGGDEFIIILEDLGNNLHEAAARAEMIADKILSAIHASFQLGAIEHHCQASIGISLYHDQDESAEEILKRADSAMYGAKQAGRNTVRFFDPAMQAALENRLKLEVELRQALPGNELRLYYQAQVDSDARIIGAEALIRWEHPLRGLVAPARFIPLAEESGLIQPIGAWVLETACAQLKEWEKLPAAHHLRLSVNVSAKQFRQSDFVSMTQRIVEQSCIDPRLLKLELTESIVIDNVADTIEKMHLLKATGLSFSMDDFGTGYSSLAYLKRLPLDQLKIDQSFVRDISSDPNDASIVATIITMGNTLGIDVIAEGVETQSQHQFLQQHGCLSYQGYLFSRPLPLADFEVLLLRTGHSPETINSHPSDLDQPARTCPSRH